MTNQTLTPEILVIGAGPGGSAAAWALANSGHDVLLVDAAEFPREKTCGDGLTPMAVRTLDRMGLLDEVLAAGAGRIDTFRITGPFGISVSTPFENYQKEFPYALVLPRIQFDDIVTRNAVGAGVEHLFKVRVEQIAREGDQITQVEAKGPQGTIMILPKHTIIAVGAKSGLLKKAGFIHHDVRYIRASRAYFTNNQAKEPLYDFYFDFELIPGYGWVFSDGNGLMNIGVGILPIPLISTKKSTSQLLEQFVQRRQKEGVLGDVELAGPIKGYPLRIDFPAMRVAGANWMIVGEAAGLVNPVTGEGIDLALESGLIAARILHDNIEQGSRNHRGYQREVWDQFGPLFTGLRVLRDVLIMPLFTDYALWLMKQHRFLTRTVMSISQGFAPPQNVFHPRFIVNFFTPITPRLVIEEIRKKRQNNDTP
ncbi:MAG: geranylgeranyl reductase family protein [Anaerolineae bacterium]|nr:geranylgeranyl reductase family protein [Anaerolineae bacterium]